MHLIRTLLCDIERVATLLLGVFSSILIGRVGFQHFSYESRGFEGRGL